MILHLVRMVGITTLIVLCVIYPFLPGHYDSLAMPLSILAQAGSMVGLLLVPVGIVWLVYEWRKRVRKEHNLPARRYYFAFASVVAISIVAIATSLVSFATVGLSLSGIVIALWLYMLARLLSKLKHLKSVESPEFCSAPLYLVLVPVAVTSFQFALATPMTSFSRNQAIASSNEFISHIEGYRAQYARYHVSLLAMYKDYYPNVVGIEKFHYTSSDNAYNLFFEQPRFLFDNLGTREWVVYNPRDEHRIFSHTSWFLLLTPEELERSQGWYAVQDTSQPHWKYFWFD